MTIPRSRHRHSFPHLLVLVPIMVHILRPILQYYIFRCLIRLLPTIFLYCNLIHGIYTDVMSKLLEVDKYAPDKSSKWRHVNARFPDLYKALLVDPDAATR